MFKEFEPIPLIDYLTKANLNSEVAVIIQVLGQLEDGTPVTIVLPDELTTHIARLVADRVTLPGSNPSITTLDLGDD